MEFNTREFRNSLGRFATGVTVITAAGTDRTHGMTVNSFTSVSLTPPLVLVSLDNKSSMHRVLTVAADLGGPVRYGISILAEDQEPISNHFAGRAQEGLHVPVIDREGVPLLHGALAHYAVTVTATHLEGDHTLYIGHVDYFAYRDGRPLLFSSGRYRRLDADRGGSPQDEFSLFSIGGIDPKV